MLNKLENHSGHFICAHDVGMPTPSYLSQMSDTELFEELGTASFHHQNMDKTNPRYYDEMVRIVDMENELVDRRYNREFVEYYSKNDSGWGTPLSSDLVYAKC